MAGCPTETLLMSDSLNATVIISVFVLMISAKPELESSRSSGAAQASGGGAAGEPLLEEELEEDPVEEEELPDPPETDWPGVRLDSEAIVPLTGA